MKMPAVFFVALFTLAAIAADTPYNETADAKSDIKQALAQATAKNNRVIVVSEQIGVVTARCWIQR